MGDALAGSSLVYGFHPVREALRHRPHEVLEVLIAAGRTGERREAITSLCRRHRVTLVEVAERELQSLAGRAHNGFAARLRTVGEPGSGGDAELVVLLEDVQDPRNLGALLRVCEGAGVGRVLVRDRGSAPLTPTVVKASAGATEWLELERIPNSAQAMRRLKEEGFWVYGADAEGEAVWSVDLTGPVLLCIGGEAKGLRPRTRALCDRLVALPMRGHVASLNVATAASALLYEALRQRAAAGLPKRGERG